MKTLSLQLVWKKRLKLSTEGDQLRSKGDQLRSKGDQLWAKGNQLLAKGDQLWADAIIEVHGNIKMEWKNWTEDKGAECHLETGEVFKP